MVEEILLETVPETPLIDPADDTEIPEMTDPNWMFTTPFPLDDGQAEFGASGNNTPEDSDELAKLIEEKIAGEIGSSAGNGKVANQSKGASGNGAEDNSKIAEFNAIPIRPLQNFNFVLK